MMSTFQHTISEIHKNEIIFFGRQHNGQSIAVRVQAYQPHAILRASIPFSDFAAGIQSAVHENYTYCFPTEEVTRLVVVEELKGRSITNADVEETFFRSDGEGHQRLQLSFKCVTW